MTSKNHYRPQRSIQTRTFMLLMMSTPMRGTNTNAIEHENDDHKTHDKEVNDKKPTMTMKMKTPRKKRTTNMRNSTSVNRKMKHTRTTTTVKRDRKMKRTLKKTIRKKRKRWSQHQRWLDHWSWKISYQQDNNNKILSPMTDSAQILRTRQLQFTN